MAVAEEVEIVRCPVCLGLRGVAARHLSRNAGRSCRDCECGRVVRREEFHEFWTSRFSAAEIEEMARALWPGSGPADRDAGYAEVSSSRL